MAAIPMTNDFFKSPSNEREKGERTGRRRTQSVLKIPFATIVGKRTTLSHCLVARQSLVEIDTYDFSLSKYLEAVNDRFFSFLLDSLVRFKQKQSNTDSTQLGSAFHVD